MTLHFQNPIGVDSKTGKIIYDLNELIGVSPVITHNMLKPSLMSYIINGAVKWAEICEGILRLEPVGVEIEINAEFLGVIGRPEKLRFDPFPEEDKRVIVKAVKIADCKNQMKIKVGRRTYMVNYFNCRTQAVKVASKLIHGV